MAIRSDEIVNIIKSAIDTFEADAETRNVGTVVEVGACPALPPACLAPASRWRTPAKA
jgi:hypothetical protein